MRNSRDILFSIAAVLLLALMAVLAGGAALRESVTIDEVAHIGAGVSYLQKLDLRFNEEHPPLPNTCSFAAGIAWSALRLFPHFLDLQRAFSPPMSANGFSANGS